MRERENTAPNGGKERGGPREARFLHHRGSGRRRHQNNRERPPPPCPVPRQRAANRLQLFLSRSRRIILLPALLPIRPTARNTAPRALSPNRQLRTLLAEEQHVGRINGGAYASAPGPTPLKSRRRRPKRGTLNEERRRSLSHQRPCIPLSQPTTRRDRRNRRRRKAADRRAVLLGLRTAAQSH